MYRPLKPRFTVQYTVAKTVRGKTRNFYRTRVFAELSAATEFYNRLLDRKDTTDVRMF